MSDRFDPEDYSAKTPFSDNPKISQLRQVRNYLLELVRSLEDEPIIKGDPKILEALVDEFLELAKTNPRIVTLFVQKMYADFEDIREHVIYDSENQKTFNMAVDLFTALADFTDANFYKKNGPTRRQIIDNFRNAKDEYENGYYFNIFYTRYNDED